jgi:protein involved in polysaccharide export with SLBB domain
MRRLKNTFFVFLLFSILNLLYAQTEQQIQKLKDSGLSDAQIKQKAEELGINLNGSNQINPTIPTNVSTPRQSDTSFIITPPSNKPLSTYKVSAFTGRGDAGNLDAFGYRVFSYSPSTFLPLQNVPTPTDYVIGPGDEIIITLYGETQFVQDLVVSKNGDINLPDVGVVDVNGLSLGALKTKLFDRLSKVYASLGSYGEAAKTFLNVSTGKLRSIKVYVLGEVNVPGGYTLPAMSTAFTSLYFSGGPQLNGTLRDIQILREGKKIADIDFYDYLLKGDASKDVRLEDGDIIFIPPVGKRVALTGDVFRPAIYELRGNEQLKYLIAEAGGLNSTAYFQNIQLERIIPFSERKDYLNNILDITLNFNSVDELKGSTYLLNDGDIISIRGVNNRLQNRVMISGDVKKPGIYQLTEGMTVRDLIIKADTLFPDAFLEKAVLIRTLPNERKEITAFNLKLALHSDPVENIKLENRDEVQVYQEERFFPAKSVEIAGYIKTPGFYNRMQKLTLSKLIILAGGITEDATTRQIEITRLDTLSQTVYANKYTVDLPQNYWEVNKENDFVLNDFDRVLIKKNPNKTFSGNVTVSGEVKFPGTYKILYDGEKAANFIKRSGGLKNSAYIKGIYILRGNSLLKLGNINFSALPDSIKYPAMGELLYSRNETIAQFSNRIPLDWNKIMSDTNSTDNIELLANDQLIVQKDDNLVYVTGSVGLPSSVPYKEGAGLGYYIEQAGGYMSNSAKGSEIVMLPNGKKWNKSGWFFIPDPDIESGSTIIVPTEIETKSDAWPVIRDIVTVVTSAAVLILSIQNLNK